jgi:hypothetical protein
MRAKAGILGFLCILLMAGPVAAIIPADVAIVGNPDWVIANGIDQSTFTVTVTNQSTAVKNATVTFTINDPNLGTMNPVNTLTDASGKAVSNFKVKTKSGKAIITATVFYSDPNGSYTIPIMLN